MTILAANEIDSLNQPADFVGYFGRPGAFQHPMAIAFCSKIFSEIHFRSASNSMAMQSPNPRFQNEKDQ